MSDKKTESEIIDAVEETESEKIESLKDEPIYSQEEMDEKIEEEKKSLREKATNWSEKKGNEIGQEKALELFQEHKGKTVEMKLFEEKQVQLGWYQDQGALPTGETAGQTMMKIMMGNKMGMSEFEAINGIAFINGRMSIWGEVMVGMVIKAGYKIEFLESTPSKCKCKISKGEMEMVDEFTFEEAKTAGWTTKGFMWSKQPKLMLRYKVIRQIIKFLCPQVMGGMITAEEAITEILPPEGKTVTSDIIEAISDKFEVVK